MKVEKIGKYLILLLFCFTLFSVYGADFVKVIVVYHPDKAVSIIYPASKSKQPSETEEDFLHRVYQCSIENDQNLQGLPYEVIDYSDLPSSNYRDAWEGELGAGVVVNSEKAQSIKEERERERLIAQEKAKILEEMAIERLKQAGNW